MRTRDVLRWHWSVRDMAELAALVGAALALSVLDRACAELERYIDSERA